MLPLLLILSRYIKNFLSVIVIIFQPSYSSAAFHLSVPQVMGFIIPQPVSLLYRGRDHRI